MSFKKIFLVCSIILTTSIAFCEVKQKDFVSTSPLPWLSGVINGSYENRIKPELGIGVNAFTWNYVSSRYLSKRSNSYGNCTHYRAGY